MESARDAHSVELEVLSELGIPGLILLLVTLAATAAGALRARRLGPAAAALSTCALASGAYWLAHSSIDWFWTYPVVTAPVFALLGSACAPAARELEPAHDARASRLLAVAGAAVLALSVLPPFLSERYLNNAYSSWRQDPDRAADDLDRARSLNPLSDQPSLAEGVIDRASGDREGAIAAFQDAVEIRPEEWAGHYFLATLYRRSDPERALAELESATDLNPRSYRLKRLRGKLEVAARAEEGR